MSGPSAEEKIYLDEIQGISKEISAFLKTLSLYPPDHPAVAPAIERVYSRVESFLAARGPLSLGVSEEELIFYGEEEKEYKLPSDLAPRLHEHEILTLKMEPGVTRDEIGRLGRLLSGPAKGVVPPEQEDSSFQDEEFPHIALTWIDYKGILERAESQADRRTDDFWAGLIRKVQSGDEDALEEMIDSLKSPKGLRTLLDTVQESFGSEASTGDAAKVFADIQEKVFSGLDAAGRQEFGRNFIEMAEEVFGVKGTRDLIGKTLACFSEDMVLEVLASAIVKAGKVDNRLTAIFQGLLDDEEEGERLLQQVDRCGEKKGDGAYPPNVWKEVRELLLAGNEKQFMSEHYHESLEDLHTQDPSELHEYFDEKILLDIQLSLSEERIRDRKRDILLDLIRVEERLKFLNEALAELRSILKNEARNGNSKRIITAVDSLLFSQEEIDSAKKLKINEGLVCLEEDDWLTYLLREVGHLEDEAFVFLRKVCSLEPKSLPEVLIRFLGEEQSLTGRKRISTLLIRLGPKALPILLEVLGDERWFLVRNAVMILGKIGDQSCLEALVPLLSHPRFQVPREVLNTFALIRSDRVVPVIRRILLNRSGQLEVGLQKAAALALKRIGTPRAGKVLREGLNDKNKRVQQICTHVLKGLV